MIFTEAEANRLLQPSNFGMRIYQEVGKVAPGCGDDGYPIEALINEIRSWPRDARDQTLALVQAFDRVATEIVIESGGTVPAGHA